ncbi:hypothetical protein G6M87_09330 [Rhizobium rhizogenes]|uniref:hypothetical protein n=1 Tax=Rhizobium rhizogenes TaxID=359 RepID=UPI001573DE72|nr:hypothetical protein [Rhizobium rhizogenes]NTI22063.1 hypothetical protein [Rhizobium rhizogenes]QTG05664.1 hypothetical protein G6M87_09330 [Rhizobium rhizogenes]
MGNKVRGRERAFQRALASRKDCAVTDIAFEKTLTNLHYLLFAHLKLNGRVPVMTSNQGNDAMTKKAFKKGFVDGFASPFSFFGKTETPTEKYQASVERAWRDVGDVFHDVMSKEGVFNGEKRHQKRRPNKQAA